jgi:hypothetical protein
MLGLRFNDPRRMVDGIVFGDTYSFEEEIAASSVELESANRTVTSIDRYCTVCKVIYACSKVRSTVLQFNSLA